jgi:dTDP-D-glucose 4,6-dehydratase
VEDVAEGLRCALDAPVDVVSGQIFNLGDNRLNATLSQVAEKIRQTFPGAAVEYVENTDRRDYRVSFDKIRRRLGFEARWTLETGIAQLQRALESEAVPDHGSPIYHNQRYLKEIGTIHSEELDTRVMAAFAEALLREERVPADR